MFLKIGELARRTGLTVRALRHYDDIGLLVPSDRSAGGYRLYTRDDVARLYRVQALRRLDLQLADIQRLLDRAGSGGDVSRVVTAQIAQLERDIVQATALRDHLLAVQQMLQSDEKPAMADWMAALESMAAWSKYFTPDELNALKAYLDEHGDPRADERARLLAELARLVADGTSPESDAAQSLATRLLALMLQDAGGDEAVLMKVVAMHLNEPSLQVTSGADRAGMALVSQAMAFARLRRLAPHVSADDMAVLRRHHTAHDEAWPRLIVDARHLQQSGAPSDGPAARAMAQQWLRQSLARTGGDVALLVKLQQAHQRDPALRVGTGIDAALAAYVDEAIARLHAAPAIAAEATR